MYSIKNSIAQTTEIKKSKFICKIIKIKNLEQIEEKLKKIKKEYKDANHRCYAYIFKGKKKFSDDGEPSGTAGMPILNVIESKKLTNILVVVIRYFGGIKLGASGLVRAYTNSVVNALDEADLVNLINGKRIEIIFDYGQEKNIKSIISDKNIIAKKYFEKVIYIVEISNNDIYLIEQFINKYEIIEDDIFLEK